MRDWAEQTAGEQIGDRPATVVLSDESSDQQRTVFLEQIARREAELAEATEDVMGDIDSPRERQFTYDLNRLFRQAYWIYQTGNFPNGRPLLEQGPLQVVVWETFLSAINERSNGGGGSGGSPDEDSYGAGGY